IPEVLAHARTGDVSDQHVRNIEHAGVATLSVMFFDLRAVVHRHVPAAEIAHGGAGRDVGVVQGCLEAHQMLRTDREVGNAKDRTGCPASSAPLSYDLRDPVSRMDTSPL